jgi:hypothetical protein
MNYIHNNQGYFLYQNTIHWFFFKFNKGLHQINEDKDYFYNTNKNKDHLEVDQVIELHKQDSSHMPNI